MDDRVAAADAGDLPEIDWDAEGIETELGWAVPLVLQGYIRLGSEAVATSTWYPRGPPGTSATATEEASSQLVLANRLGIDKTQMTYVIDALEAGGFVERRPDPTDRRVRQVHPTDAGHALLTRTRRALRGAEGVLMRHLSADEQVSMRRLLARVALGAVGVDPAFPHPLAVPERSRRRTHTTTSSTSSTPPQ
jgi:DNA-binding MarR family transcriptional regulator